MTPTAPLLPITLRDLAFRPGGRAVLNGLCATIAAPGITAIIGPNGAGKSVTLRVIDGLLRPDGGSVRFGARPADAVGRGIDVGDVEVEEPALGPHHLGHHRADHVPAVTEKSVLAQLAHRHRPVLPPAERPAVEVERAGRIG